MAALIVLAAAFAMHLAFAGTHFAFGVFLKPVTEDLGWSRGAMSFAYTLLWWVAALAALFMGWLSDKYGPRWVLLFGGFVFGLGLFLSSRVENLWQLYLYFGVLGGIGRSCARAPLLSAVFQHFTKRRGLAMGITLSGTGIGTLIFPVVARYAIAVEGWRVAFVWISILAWLILLPAALMIRKPKTGEAESSGGDGGREYKEDKGGLLGGPDKEWTVKEVLHHRAFWLTVVTGFFCCTSHSMPVAHIVAYASDRGIDDLSAASVLSIIGISAALGRLLWGAVSDKIGPRKTVLCCISLQTLMIFLAAFAETRWAFYAFAVAYGVPFGGVLPLYAVVCRELFGMHRFATIYSMQSLGTSWAMGIGPMLGGYLFDNSGSYFLPFMTSSAFGVMATIFAVRLAYLKWPGTPSEVPLPVHAMPAPASS